jgi:predicted dehydrogenase
MKKTERREFIKSATVGALGLSLASRTARATEASQRVVVGLVGVGGMGSNHLGMLARESDVQVAYVCDVDRNHLSAAAREVEAVTGRAPAAVTDLRHVLDDRAVDAVLIATPDHWHAPAAILALDAGKHVYVEKPCCHNIREGRLMAEACQRTGKRLQVGTQSRSTGFVQEAIERVLRGEIGEVLVAKAWNSQRRGSIGKAAPGEPPAHLDFDLWLGPAPTIPFRANLLHSTWRWFYDFGCGDIGNDGVHDIDVALWGLGIDTDPTTVACLGGKYYFDDDQEFPDTQYAVFEYPATARQPRKRQLIFEQRTWSPYVQEGYENGAAFYGTQGLLILGHSVGWKLYGPRNELRAEGAGSADLAAHHRNFFDCIRGSQQQLNADIDVGVRAATIVHLANIAARLNRTLQFDVQSSVFPTDQEANEMVGRTYRDQHWAVPRSA